MSVGNEEFENDYVTAITDLFSRLQTATLKTAYFHIEAPQLFVASANGALQEKAKENWTNEDYAAYKMATEKLQALEKGGDFIHMMYMQMEPSARYRDIIELLQTVDELIEMPPEITTDQADHKQMARWLNLIEKLKGDIPEGLIESCRNLHELAQMTLLAADPNLADIAGYRQRFQGLLDNVFTTKSFLYNTREPNPNSYRPSCTLSLSQSPRRCVPADKNCLR